MLKKLPAIIILSILFIRADAYLGTEMLLDWYIKKGADSLIEKEKKGELSREYGFVWAEINLARKMQKTSRDIIISGTDSLLSDRNSTKGYASSNSPNVDKNTPSLAAIRELLRIQRVSNFITITDRNDNTLAEIKTTHTRLKLKDFNPVLINSILAAEDQNFRNRNTGYEYKSFVRATFRAAIKSIKEFKIVKPKGTSTIHQQVAKFLLSRFDERGMVYAERSLDRKVKEMKLAQALKMTYRDDDILEVYLNHCVDAGHGMTGFYDISMGLFNKKPSQLDICQSLYLARLVKWNRNIPAKITAQIKIDMPRIAPLMGWNQEKQDSIVAALPKLKFLKPNRIASEHSPLIDLANEYWLKVCRSNGMSDQEIKEMDFTSPTTMIRKKGSLKIQLSIDIELQKFLETQVKKRGFGRDTTIVTDVRIGSFGEDLFLKQIPKDTLRHIQKLKTDTTFTEPGSNYFTALKAGDTLVSNIRYKRKGEYRYRRSVYLYKRDETKVAGQYFSYAIMNSATGELLAYYSRDGIGSRLGSLLRNRTPNGSCLAKPLIYALNYDWNNIRPEDRETDSIEVPPPAAWQRKFLISGDKPIGMTYLNTTAPGGYPVSNYGKKFSGEDYIFNHLTESNNIISVEMIYRL
ncbi:MAG: transglycosylase domain-containing protein, partial [Fibrobacteres bacterium]|nr:transglycosylase domain-containing protein [Fibrobacterota bacterium]